jgi:hypothetical protein
VEKSKGCNIMITDKRLEIIARNTRYSALKKDKNYIYDRADTLHQDFHERVPYYIVRKDDNGDILLGAKITSRDKIVLPSDFCKALTIAHIFSTPDMEIG